MAKLTDLCDIQYGYAFDSALFTDDCSYPQLVRIRDVKRGYSETFYNGDYPEEYVLSAGDLLIGMDGEFNIARWKVDGALLNQRVCKITAKDNADEEFLRFALSKALKAIEERTSFATVKHLSAKELNKLEIAVPSYGEQKNKSEILRRLERIIKLRQNELNSLDNLIKARFVEMFFDKGYPVLPWNDVFNTTTGKLDSNAMVENGEYPFFTCAKEVFRIDRYAFDQEALLLAGNNAAGKYDVKYYKGKFNAYQRTYVLGLKQNWSYRLFQYQLEDKLEYLQQLSLGGLTKYLTMKILRELSFIIPSMDKQIEFEQFVKQVDKSKVVVKKALDEAQILFDSLMQEYFG